MCSKRKLLIHNNLISVLFICTVCVGFFIHRYMYSGKLEIKDDSQLQEAIAISDYLQMTTLKSALDHEARYHVVPSNVLSWSMFADVHNLPLLTDMCNRIQVLKFRKVVQNAEFSKLSKEDLKQYLQKCRKYPTITGDDLLIVAMTWMQDNELLDDLLEEMEQWHDKPSVLKPTPVIPAAEKPCVVYESASETKLSNKTVDIEVPKQTVAYTTAGICIVTSKDDKLRELQNFKTEKKNPLASTLIRDERWIRDEHWVNYTDDGFVVTKGTLGLFRGQCIVHKFRYAEMTLQELPNSHHGSLVISFTTIQNNKLFIFPDGGKILHLYDLEKCSWAPDIILPVFGSLNNWSVTSINNDVYLLSSELYLYRLRDYKLDQIGLVDRKEITFPMGFFDIVAVHHWLYIFGLSEGGTDMHVFCYNPDNDIWTDEDKCSGMRQLHRSKGAVVFENKVFMSASIFPYLPDCILLEYNLLDGTMAESKRPYPQQKTFRPVLLPVDAKHLDADSPLREFS